jgi:hypothetical protein
LKAEIYFTDPLPSNERRDAPTDAQTNDRDLVVVVVVVVVFNCKWVFTRWQWYYK